MSVSFNDCRKIAIMARQRVKPRDRTGGSPHMHEEFIGPGRGRPYFLVIECDQAGKSGTPGETVEHTHDRSGASTYRPVRRPGDSRTTAAGAWPQCSDRACAFC